MGFPSYSNEIPWKPATGEGLGVLPINPVEFRIEKLGEAWRAGSLIKPQQKSPRFDG